jgi:hypothetical protein
LVPAIKLVKKRFPAIQITAYVPARDRTRGAAKELRDACDKDKTLPLGLLEKCQFASDVTDVRGGIIAKPSGW